MYDFAIKERQTRSSSGAAADAGARRWPAGLHPLRGYEWY